MFIIIVYSKYESEREGGEYSTCIEKYFINKLKIKWVLFISE